MGSDGTFKKVKSYSSNNDEWQPGCEKEKWRNNKDG
jgi:hypothetical protein